MSGARSRSAFVSVRCAGVATCIVARAAAGMPSQVAPVAGGGSSGVAGWRRRGGHRRGLRRQHGRGGDPASRARSRARAALAQARGVGWRRAGPPRAAAAVVGRRWRGRARRGGRRAGRSGGGVAGTGGAAGGTGGRRRGGPGGTERWRAGGAGGGAAGAGARAGAGGAEAGGRRGRDQRRRARRNRRRRGWNGRRHGRRGGCATPPPASALVGWASVNGMNQNGTTGGGNATPVVVTTAAAFTSNIGGTTARVIYVMGSFSGSFSIGSNKTIIGLCGARVTGHIGLSGSVNVIIRNLQSSATTAATVPTTAAPARTRSRSARARITSGSITTTSATAPTATWTSPGLRLRHHLVHQVLVFDDAHRSDGRRQRPPVLEPDRSADNVPEDVGHLNVTLHHNWWAQNVNQRMPRTRRGNIHVFNNLYTSAGNSYCTNAGIDDARAGREQRVHRREQPAVARRERRHARARQPVPERHRQPERRRRVGVHAARTRTRWTRRPACRRR